jgi:hypothetical protein
MPAPLKLTSTMPDGKSTKLHPLHWCLRNRMPEGANLSDVARYMDIKPQSLYKWMVKAETDRHFSLPLDRAMEMGEYFKVHPKLFRPDACWSATRFT